MSDIQEATSPSYRALHEWYRLTMEVPKVNSEWAIADDTEGIYMRVIKVKESDTETLVTFKLLGNDKDVFATPLTVTLEEFWHDARPMPQDVKLSWWQRLLDFFGGFKA